MPRSIPRPWSSTLLTDAMIVLLITIFCEARPVFDFCGKMDNSIRLLPFPEAESSLVEMTKARRYWPMLNSFSKSTSSDNFLLSSAPSWLSSSSSAAIASSLRFILSEIEVIGTYPVRLFGKESAISSGLI
jgi:hypothetical protein